jgi:hypothetical protein
MRWLKKTMARTCLRRRKMPPLSMRTSAFKPHLHCSLSWLFWLALLLPVAQSAAAWHGYSHVRAESSEREPGKQAPHAAQCDLCLSAAAVIGGALVGRPPGLAILAARHALPQPAATSVWQALPTLAYLSRAPPSALR